VSDGFRRSGLGGGCAGEREPLDKQRKKKDEGSTIEWCECVSVEDTRTTDSPLLGSGEIVGRIPAPGGRGGEKKPTKFCQEESRSKRTLPREIRKLRDRGNLQFSRKI